MEIPFLKKLAPVRAFWGNFFSDKPTHVVGIDVGTYSTKVVQLRYEKEHGILETYGELLNEGYFSPETKEVGFSHHSDAEIVAILQDLLKEANVTSKEVVFSVPAGSSFITTITFPQVSEKELVSAIPYEARRYIPIPISEVVLDWEVLGTTEERDKMEVLLIAVPREIVEKFKRIAEGAGLHLRSLEVETFSVIRSIGRSEAAPTLFINLGHLATTIAIADRGRLRVSHNFSRGSHELTRTLSRGLNISLERAEAIKREVGMSEKLEEREIASVIAPFVENLYAEIERFVAIYNRKAPRTVQKINLTGGGSNLKGLVEHTVSKFGVEVARGNPFSQIVAPAFMQPTLREIGPSFSVAMGLSLHEITSK